MYMYIYVYVYICTVGWGFKATDRTCAAFLWLCMAIAALTPCFQMHCV